MEKNLNYVVENYRLSNGIVGTQYDQQYLQWAISGLKKLKQLGLVQEIVKAVELTIDKENNTANLPEDFDTNSFIRMGICRNGVFINFDKNDALCLPEEKICPCEPEHIQAQINACCNGGGTDFPLWVYPIYGQPYSYSYTVGSYAIGPSFYHGGYKIDYAKRKIVFDACVTVDTCIIEYFGSVVGDMGNALISEALEEVLFNYIHWCRCRFAIDQSISRQQQQAYSTYYQSVRDLNSSQQALTKHDWVALMRRYVYQGVKA